MDITSKQKKIPIKFEAYKIKGQFCKICRYKIKDNAVKFAD